MCSSLSPASSSGDVERGMATAETRFVVGKVLVGLLGRDLRWVETRRRLAEREGSSIFREVR